MNRESAAADAADHLQRHIVACRGFGIESGVDDYRAGVRMPLDLVQELPLEEVKLRAVPV